MISEVFGSFWALLYLALTIVMVVVVLMRKREPAAALGWSLVIVLLPILGSVLFLTLGVSELPRRLKRKVAHRHAFADRLTPGAATVDQTPPDPLVAAAWEPGLRLLDSLGEPPTCPGNRVSLLEHGPEAFEQMRDAIQAAKHHIHLEMYIFRYDALGKALLDLLVHKAEQGIEVRLLVDYVGTLQRWRVLRKLRKAGGEGAVFLPLFAIGKRFAPNLRNHRKILVCDGRVGYFGGLNVGEEYLGRKRRDRDWCDAQIELRGPAVADLQALFVEDWDFASGKMLAGSAYFPAHEKRGDAPVRIVSGGPDRRVNPIREAYFYAITHARKRLYIASPYIVADHSIRTAMKSAARSGVDIRLITQSAPPDNYLAELAGSFYFEEMMRAGIRIFRYMPGMMHAKLLLADDDVAAVGSANLDNRSLGLNFELIGIFSGRAEVGAVQARFDEMFDRCQEVTPDTFGERPRLRRVAEGLARLLSPLL